MEKVHNTHHCLCSSRCGTNKKDNKVKLDIRVHNALHMMFANATPPEQFARLLNINSTALTEEVQSDIIKILSNSELDYWYRKGIHKKHT